MDPLTHAVAGAAIAATARGRGARTGGAALTIVVAVLAGIAPDIDYFDRPSDGHDHGLYYLLYHRGLTHTVLGCLLLSALIVLPTCVSNRARRMLPRLFLIAFAASLAHVAMDGTNDYGIHPFWPFWNGWLYGDFIFLAEPLVISSLLPLALSGVLQDWGSRRLNLTMAALAGFLVIASFLFPWIRVWQQAWVTPFSASLASLWLAGQLAIALTTRSRVAMAWVALVTVWAAFFCGSRLAKQSAETALHALAPGERQIQLDATPAAANPLCWRVVSGGFDPQRQQVVARIGVISLAPDVIAPARCLIAAPKKPRTFQLAPSPEPSESSPWIWLGYVVTPLRDFTAAAERHSRVAAARHFLRTPVLQNVGGKVILGDLRLDYETALDKYCKYELPEVPDVSPFCPVDWKPPFFDSPLLRQERTP